MNATTSEVLPKMGLAYLGDENRRTWAVARQDTGACFDALAPGKAVRLTVAHYDQKAVPTLVDRLIGSEKSFAKLSNCLQSSQH